MVAFSHTVIIKKNFIYNLHIAGAASWNGSSNSLRKIKFFRDFYCFSIPLHFSSLLCLVYCIRLYWKLNYERPITFINLIGECWSGSFIWNFFFCVCSTESMWNSRKEIKKTKLFIKSGTRFERREKKLRHKHILYIEKKKTFFFVFIYLFLLIQANGIKTMVGQKKIECKKSPADVHVSVAMSKSLRHRIVCRAIKHIKHFIPFAGVIQCNLSIL